MPRISVCSPPARSAVDAVVAHPPSVGSEGGIAPASMRLGRADMALTVFQELRQYSFFAQVEGRAKYGTHAAAFALTLHRAVYQSQRFESLVQVQLLVDAIQDGAAVYLAALVHERNHDVSASAQLSLSCLQCLEDVLVLLMGFYPVDKANFHRLPSVSEARILRYAREYVRRVACRVLAP